MNESVFSEIAGYAGFLKPDLTVREIAVLSEEMKLEEKDVLETPKEIYSGYDNSFDNENINLSGGEQQK